MACYIGNGFCTESYKNADVDSCKCCCRSVTTFEDIIENKQLLQVRLPRMCSTSTMEVKLQQYCLLNSKIRICSSRYFAEHQIYNKQSRHNTPLSLQSLLLCLR